MMPASITDVTSATTLVRRATAWAGVVQYGQLATGTPAADSSFAPHNANAEVTPQGRPAITSVATFTIARPRGACRERPRTAQPSNARRAGGLQPTVACPLDRAARERDRREQEQAHSQ